MENYITRISELVGFILDFSVKFDFNLRILFSQLDDVIVLEWVE